ncbi:MAG: hypothetical protein CL902_03515 [Dehalococcoidia bacterium]|nr:hypothetical protein [Dehalococcoidia bacterium]|tara:strand:- start:272 stop:793 length:522 start_codon:yes stop_codon:yes gene_type:complete
MALNYPNELRDPVHGLIRLSDQEIELINTGPFQRLRRIRQLAAADLVFPGAVHTRFDHSLGTMHIAGRLLNHLRLTNEIDDSDVEIVRLAALLHDIGHGPFSHVSDYLLGKYYDKATVGETPREKIHEKVTVDIINNLEVISSLLTTNQKIGISKIILGDSSRDYRRDIERYC